MPKLTKHELSAMPLDTRRDLQRESGISTERFHNEIVGMPVEERRRLQREAGLLTVSFLIKTRAEINKVPYFKRKRVTKMQQETHQATPDQEASKKRRALEEFLHEFGSTEPALKTAKKAAIQAAVWTPVALGVGYGLIRIARRVWMG